MSERRIEIKDGGGMVKFVLKFKEIHDSRKLYSGTGEHNLFLIIGAMRCYVEYPDGSHLGMGHSFCHHKDKWDTRKGERVALKDALKYKNDKLQREGRRWIWSEYFKQRPIVEPPTEREIRKAKARERMKKRVVKPTAAEPEVHIAQQEGNI